MEMDKNMKPLCAITMGDPAGIGPEIALKALVSNGLPQCSIFTIGDMEVLEQAKRFLSISPQLNAISNVGEIKAGYVNVLDMKQVPVNDFSIGKVQANCGRASYNYVIKGIELALKGDIDAIVTNPISKEALKMAGINYPGHTEILADKTGTKNFSMMFTSENVHVVHVTTHVSLKQALTMITKEAVLTHTRLLNTALRNLGIKSPRIAISGLNPHAGENGLFGDEEILHIAPAVVLAKKEGIDASGPFPPDTVFMRAFKGEFDGVVSMLHDHGFVALKTRNFEGGVNSTLGLPIIRTSVGHGTAFDIAGKGIASENSLIAAIEAAVKMAENKHAQLKS
jgi:4-phospho-D-threonate 3-dehydrogenase / 4-phospho-D-erythronate 3-dehydrogenase